jgi:hypothetical protein
MSTLFIDVETDSTQSLMVSETFKSEIRRRLIMDSADEFEIVETPCGYQIAIGTNVFHGENVDFSELEKVIIDVSDDVLATSVDLESEYVEEEAQFFNSDGDEIDFCSSTQNF